jgi:PAS domain S-box-containing protein
MKYRGKRFDAVFALDDDALQFLIAHHKTLFPAAPVVFCGINHLKDGMLEGQPWFTGIVESIDIEATIAMGLQLRPAARHVLVITDNTTTGRANRDFLEKLARSRRYPAEFVFLDRGGGLTLDELVAALKTSPTDSIVYYSDFFQDREGNALQLERVMARVSAAAPGPVFVHGAIYLGYGAVGGKLNSGFHQGEAAARLAERVWTGVRPSDIPVVREDVNRYMFDHGQLKRWKISLQAIPAGSVVVNREIGFYERFWPWIWGVSVFVVIEAIIIALLAASILRRRRTEEALRESEARYATIFNTVHDALFLHDENGGVLDVNAPMAELFGVARDEARGMSISRDFSGPGNPVEEMPSIWKRVAAGEKVVLEWNARRPKDGTCFPTEVWLQGISLGYRRLVLASVRDITERKQMEQFLRDSEERLKTIVNSLEVGVVIVDTLTHEITSINPKALALFGATESEVIGKICHQFICPTEKGKCPITDLGRELDSSERVMLTAKGERVPIIKSVVRTKISDRDCLVESFIDVSERERAEKERLELERRLLHAQKLESLGVLAGGIAHDFNNLLMAVLGNLDLSLMVLSPASPARSNIEQAVRATHRATDLTRQMLAYSGKGRFVVTPLDLSVLVQENAELFRTVIPRSVSVNMSLNPEPSIVQADPGQMQQIIMNLITNAAEAVGNAPGVITISTGVMECDGVYLERSRLEHRPSPGYFAYVEVADNGCGMDENARQRLFDPFFTTKFTGRGLGMSAVLGIVRGHKGAIMVDSERGAGTSIRVLFPVSDHRPVVRPESSGPPERDSGKPLYSPMVLVVDDEETVRRLCLEYVKRLGFQGIGASDGEEALAVFKAHTYDIVCVLLDLTMPRMDGVRTFQEMKRLRSDVKVILCSGYGEHDAMQRFKGEGLAGFVQKPYRMEELKAKIELALQ